MEEEKEISPRTIVGGTILYSDLHNNYLQTSSTTYGKSDNPYHTGYGSYRNKNISAFPDAQFNFEKVGDENPEDFFQNARNGLLYEHAHITFYHNYYDSPEGQNDQNYLVKVTLLQMTEVYAGGSKSADKSSNLDRKDVRSAGKEWSFQHTTGFVDSDNVTQIFGPYDGPSPSDPIHTTDSNGQASINRSYVGIMLGPGKGGATITTSAEVDRKRVTDEYFLDSVRKFTSLLWNIWALIPGLPSYRDFSIELVGHIWKWISASGFDDLMNPVVNVFSQGAARYIYENCPNGTFTFRRKVHGANSGICDVAQPPAHWVNRPQVFVTDIDNGRKFILEYKVVVTKPITLNQWYQIRNKKSGLCLAVPNSSMASGVNLIQYQSISGLQDQHFCFEKSSLPEYNHIRVRHSNALLGHYDGGPHFHPDASNVIQHTNASNGDHTFYFRIIPAGGNLVKIACLEGYPVVIPEYGSTVNGARIGMALPNDLPEELWELIPVD